MLLVSILITLLMKYVSLECVVDQRSPSIEWQEKLIAKFKKNYTDLKKPPKGNCTTVSIKFVVKNFYFDTKEEEFTIQSWMFFSWEDPRLKWNPSDYGEIDDMILSFPFFWTPMTLLRLENDIDQMTSYSYYTASCQITNTGRAFCIPRIIHTITCSSELHNWPYDTKKCSFKFYIRKEIKDKVIFTFNRPRGVSTFGAEYGSGWDIIDYETGENATGDTNLYLNFIVERHALGCAAIIVIPSITVAILTMATMVLDIKNSFRLGLSIFNLICNFFLLKSVGEIIPHQGFDTPSILYFIHSSLYITTGNICLLLILSSLTRRRDSSHQWIARFNYFVLNHRIIKHVVFDKWMKPSRALPVETNYVEKWTDFSIIINSLMFFIVLIAYLILYLMYIPQPRNTY